MPQNAKAKIPAFGYIRMSTDRQEKSPAQQRQEILKLATLLGCHIVRWYIDEGITGDSIQQRPQFSAMLVAAADPTGSVKTILAWDMSRFGRFNPFEGGAVIAPLMKAGVRLCTVIEGQIDWNSFSGQVLSTIQMAANHDFLRKLSANVVRGIIGRPDGGFIPHVPVGMVRIFCDQSGKEVARAEWDEKMQKAPGWSVKLGVSESAERLREREAIRWAFEQFASGRESLGSIALGLEIRGVLGRNGLRLYRSTVKSLLSNPKYVGRIEIGTQPSGKYFRMGSDGSIEPTPSSPEWFGPNKKRSPLRSVVAGDGLISEALFDAVQKRLRLVSMTPFPIRVRFGLLSGILRCAACGTRMFYLGNTGPDYIGGGGRRYSYYRCMGHERGIGFGGAENGCHSVHAEPLDDYAVRIIEALADATGSADRIREAIRRKLGDAPSKAGSGARSALAEIEREIEIGQANLLRVEGEDLESLKRKLAGHRMRRDDLMRELETADETPLAGKDLEARAIKLADDLRHACDTSKAGDLAALRAVALSVFKSITIRTRTLSGKSNTFEGGTAVIDLSAGPLSTLVDSGGLEMLRKVPLFRTAEIVDLPD